MSQESTKVFLCPAPSKPLLLLRVSLLSTSSPQLWYLCVETRAMTTHHHLVCSINGHGNTQHKGSIVYFSLHVNGEMTQKSRLSLVFFMPLWFMSNTYFQLFKQIPTHPASVPTNRTTYQTHLHL
jgi:hypothetical protein